MAARSVLFPFVESLFRLLFTYDCLGEEHVPAQGGAVVAANHPSYLDPILLSLQVRRPIHFMAAEFLFRIPLLGAVLRAFGAFPVDTRRGKGREAYERAKASVSAGKVVGIFPEGRRSTQGWMEASLREGAARLAWETGAPLVPATITGAFRAWPHFQSLPRPARVRVRFHEPIDPAPFRGRPEAEALGALLALLRQRVERSLLPGVKADLRKEVLYRAPGPPPRPHELALALGAAALGAAAGAPTLAVAGALYAGYLFADWRLGRSSRLLKWLRNGSPLLLGLALLPAAARAVGAPAPLAPAALWAIGLGAGFPYLYERGRTAVAFVRGAALAVGLVVGTLAVAPSAAGLHVALPLYCALFAGMRRTVFWPYAAPVLLAHAVAAAVLLGGGGREAPHAVAGAVAALVAVLLPDPARARPTAAVAGEAQAR
ncbi:MAG TPA: lysophospholipid acyltransferase family protein [Vicinamibacteria bacterium]